jgi:putative ABC transport system permease protein
LNAGKYPTPERQIAFFERLLERSTTMPGVVAAAVTDSVPPAGSMRTMIFAAIEVEGRPLPAEGTGGMVPWRSVTPGYFDALRIPVVQGRPFAESDRRSGEPAMILSESLAKRLFPNNDALGKRIRPGRGEQPWHTVVGIARDVRNAGLTTSTEPEYYAVRGLAARDAMRRSFLLVRTASASPVVSDLLRRAIAEIDPGLPVTVERMDRRVSELAARPRFTALLLLSFGALALALAAAGVGGVAGYLVTQRTRDIGVRMALGATPAAVRRDVLGEAARWVLGGALGGTLAAVATSRVAGSMMYGVAPYDPWAWAGAIAILTVTLFAAVLRPALRAARIDPVSALRAEG